jgi:RNA polymerase sigma factor (sigma-70 family)
MDSLDEPVATGTGNLLYDIVADPETPVLMERAEDHEWLTRLLRDILDDRQRGVITATYFEGMADAEIARALDITVANVQLIRHRALRRLKEAVRGLKE